MQFSKTVSKGQKVSYCNSSFDYLNFTKKYMFAKKINDPNYYWLMLVFKKIIFIFLVIYCDVYTSIVCA